jgi:hypothetical protein
MGVSLAAGARRHADGAAAWQRESRRASGLRPTGRPPSLVLYRLTGFVVAAAGAAIASGWLSRGGPPAFWERADPRAMGALIGGFGVGLGALNLLNRPPAAPLFIGDAPKRRLDERLAGACAWALCAVWIAFGAALLGGAR